MNLRFALALVLAAVTPVGAWCADAPVQSQAKFEYALDHSSIGGSYVALTVVDDNTGVARSLCTNVNFLVGAIHLEHLLAYDAAGNAEARRRVLSQRDHVFHFAQARALANIPALYSPDDLAVVREQLRGLSDAQLRMGFAPRGSLNSMYDHEGLSMARRDAYREATACALVERGLSPQKADITGQILLLPEDGTFYDVTLPASMPTVRIEPTLHIEPRPRIEPTR